MAMRLMSQQTLLLALRNSGDRSAGKEYAKFREGCQCCRDLLAQAAAEAPAQYTAEPGRSYAVPSGPTYLRGGVPMNVVDSKIL